MSSCPPPTDAARITVARIALARIALTPPRKSGEITASSMTSTRLAGLRSAVVEFDEKSRLDRCSDGRMRTVVGHMIGRAIIHGANGGATANARPNSPEARFTHARPRDQRPKRQRAVSGFRSTT
jgi:hypothetical protein